MPAQVLRSRAIWLAAVPLALPLTLVSTGAAFATWSAGGAGGAGGAARAMPTGSAPSGTVSVNSVTLSWAAASFTGGAAVAGYKINRYDSVTGAPASVGAGCSGVVSTTTCTETSVTPGTWVYTDTPVQLSWTGGESSDSGVVTVRPT